jgi:transposase
VKLRKAWRRKIRRVDAGQLRFIDESGAKTNMTRLYGRCKGGERLVDSTPNARWETTTMIGAVDAKGSTELMVIEGATDGAVFRAYVKHVLAPTLRPGEIVVMDNLSSHKSAAIREMIEATGAELWYLPPYSPDFNPIEKMWSKVKASLRASKPRVVEEIHEAVRKALKQITPQDARGWYESCECRYGNT